jgi:HEAT repeat protein
MEELYLDGAVYMLGELKVKEAEENLSRILLDRTADRRTRAWAAKSLGQIDAEANKNILLEALRPHNYHLIRINAAEALANTKDRNVLRTLEAYSREERDDYVRQRLQKATDKLRAKRSP